MKLDIGSTISSALGSIKSRFGGFFGLWAVYFGLTIVATFAFALMAGAGGLAGASLIGPDGVNPAGLGALGGGFILAMILFYLSYIYLTMAQSASMVALASPLADATFGQALSLGFRAGLPLLGTGVLLVIGYFVIAMPISLAARALGSVGSILSLGLVVLIVYLGCRLGLVSAVAAVERVTNPIEIIRRSWEITQGSVLRIFLVFVIMVILMAVTIGILVLPVFGTISQGTVPGGGMIAYMVIAFVLAFMLFGAIQNSVIAAMHNQLSGRTGEDLQDTFS